MQGQIAALSRRVEKLEIQFHSAALASGDDKEAQILAETMGFPVEIVFTPQPSSPQREKLARALKAKKWSNERIARVMKVSERTVRTWTK